MNILAFLISLSFFTTEKVDTTFKIIRTTYGDFTKDNLENFSLSHKVTDEVLSTDTTKQIWAVTERYETRQGGGETGIKTPFYQHYVPDTFLILEGKTNNSFGHNNWLHYIVAITAYNQILSAREGHNQFADLIEATGDTIQDLQGKVMLPIIREEQ